MAIFIEWAQDTTCQQIIPNPEDPTCFPGELEVGFAGRWARFLAKLSNLPPQAHGLTKANTAYRFRAEQTIRHTIPSRLSQTDVPERWPTGPFSSKSEFMLGKNGIARRCRATVCLFYPCFFRYHFSCEYFSASPCVEISTIKKTELEMSTRTHYFSLSHPSPLQVGVSVEKR